MPVLSITGTPKSPASPDKIVFITIAVILILVTAFGLGRYRQRQISNAAVTESREAGSDIQFPTAPKEDRLPTALWSPAEPAPAAVAAPVVAPLPRPRPHAIQAAPMPADPVCGAKGRYYHREHGWLRWNCNK